MPYRCANCGRAGNWAYCAYCAKPMVEIPVLPIPRPIRVNLRKVAIYQKCILACIVTEISVLIVVAILAGVIDLPAPLQPLFGPSFLLVITAIQVVCGVFVLIMALKVYPDETGIVLGVVGIVSLAVGTIFPCAGVCIMFVINTKATALLRESGVRVGWLGANLSELPPEA